MSDVIVALSLLGYIIVEMVRANSQKWKKEAYQWWYMPWLCLLFVVLVFIGFRWLNSKINVFSSSVPYVVETSLFIWCYAMWIVALRPALRALSKKGLQFYRKNFAEKEEHPEKALPFPYYLNEAGELKARVGLTFYRWTLKVLLLIVGFLYAVAIALVGLAHTDFYLLSVFGLLGLLPIVEYYDRAAGVCGGPEKLRDFYSLYLLPGRRHAGDGKGAGAGGAPQNLHSKIVAWVEKGERPGNIVLNMNSGPVKKLEIAPY